MQRLAEHVVRARRVAQWPPRAIARRLVDEATRRSERVRGPLRAARFDEAALLARTGAVSLEELWTELASRPWLGTFDPVASALPEEVLARLQEAAERAAAHRVEFLGSGPVDLGPRIDWQRDFKSGARWPLSFGPGIDYAELGQPSDVKVPWELSRGQWLLPAAQTYLLTRDETHARAVRKVLESWIAANPYGRGVNWSIAMEPALRILTWTWLFHALAGSKAWEDGRFRSDLLQTLYLHGDFVKRHLERSHVNGNHLAADAAALVAAGLFFGDGTARWAELGWSLLLGELPRQVGDDGVDFEASTAYHRLVTELFLLPALLRRAHGLPIPAWYVGRLAAMAAFANTYTRDDGTSPLWGDTDDARALPLGTQPLWDHRYLAPIVKAAWPDAHVEPVAGAPLDEAYWLVGATTPASAAPPSSQAFPTAGAYVMRGERDHVFVDAGPVGLAGRGGHGHNDCLSFEAFLDGRLVVSDCGSFVYTSDVAARNRFRSTASHNTPRVDDEEQNRLTGSLWSLEYDAVPTVEAWRADDRECVLVARHVGYGRLRPAVTVRRALVLDLPGHRLAIRDELLGLEPPARAAVPFHFAIGVEAAQSHGCVLLTAGRRSYTLAYGAGWSAALLPAWVSPAYGEKHRAPCVELRSGAKELVTALGPGRDPAGLLDWAERRLGELR